jgi:hypothetical protein
MHPDRPRDAVINIASRSRVAFIQPTETLDDEVALNLVGAGGPASRGGQRTAAKAFF